MQNHICYAPTKIIGFHLSSYHHNVCLFPTQTIHIRNYLQNLKYLIPHCHKPKPSTSVQPINTPLIYHFQFILSFLNLHKRKRWLAGGAVYHDREQVLFFVSVQVYELFYIYLKHWNYVVLINSLTFILLHVFIILVVFQFKQISFLAIFPALPKHPQRCGGRGLQSA